VSKGVAQKTLVPTRVYAPVLGEPKGGSKVVIDTAPILGFEASILFDLGATHFFVSIVFIRLSRLIVRTLEPGLAITTPLGKTVVCKRVVYKCHVSICGRVLPANLVVLPMFSYSIMLRTDWLTKHSAVIDCAQKQVLHKFNCTRQLHESLSSVASVQVQGRSHKESCFVKNQFKLPKLIIS
jgi:hypothetical protein